MDVDKLTSMMLSSALIVALSVAGLVLVYVAGKLVLKKVRTLDGIEMDRRQQFETLVQISRWVLDIAILATALLMLLSTFGLDIAPLIAGVGVVGLALSLGTQTLIKDLIGGLLIVVENQYSVGDTIEVGDVSGVVETVTLRATLVRTADGSLVVVPNGEVRVVANASKGWSRAVVDVGVAYEEDLARALSVLEDAAAEFAQDTRFEPLLLEAPAVLGPLSLGDWSITIRVMIKTLPGRQWEIARELRKQILAACEREGIDLPYPRQEVWVRSSG